MTDTLTDLMHRRAEATTFEPPDLASLTLAGDRALRRRRSLTAAAGGVAVAAVVGGAGVLLPGTGSDRADVATPPASAPAPVSWVTGSTLHVEGERDVDLGADVASYVRTGQGFVFVDRTGRVHSWVDGASTDIGLAARSDLQLVADPDTATAAFVEGGEGAAQVVVFDQVREAVHRLPAEGGQVELYGLDGDTVFWRDARGIVAGDADAGNEEVVAAGEPQLRLTDVEAGVHATTNGQGTVVGERPGDGVPLPEAYGSVGALSPDGRYYSSEGDEQAVFDTTSGERVELDLTQRFATGYEWLDATTLAVLAAERPREDETAQLLSCTVPDGRCHIVIDDLGTFEELQGSAALPTGQPLG